MASQQQHSDGDCRRCGQREDALTFRCFDCQGLQHQHLQWWLEVEPRDIAVVICPGCGSQNALVKPAPSTIRGHRVTASAMQAQLPREEEDGDADET